MLETLSSWWRRARDAVVQDVPASLEACESCRETDCTQSRWQQCARRLAEEAALCGEVFGPVGRTDEMPSVTSAPGQDGAVVAETEALADGSAPARGAR